MEKRHKLRSPVEWLGLLISRVDDDMLMLAGDDGTIRIPLSATEYWRIKAEISRGGNNEAATRPDR